MTRFLATFLAVSIPLLAWVAWRWRDEAHREQLAIALCSTGDRLTAYRRWAEFADQDAAFRRRWAL